MLVKTLTRKQRAEILNANRADYQIRLQSMVSAHRPKFHGQYSFGIFSWNGNSPFYIVLCQWNPDLPFPGRFLPRKYFSKKPIPWGGWSPHPTVFQATLNTHHARWMSDHVQQIPIEPRVFSTLFEAKKHFRRFVSPYLPLKQPNVFGKVYL